MPGKRSRTPGASRPQRPTGSTANTWIVRAKSGGPILSLRQRLAMTRSAFARLFPVSERSVASIEAGKSPSESFQRRHRELDRITHALEEVVCREAIGEWLQAPNDALNSFKPIELIERGEIDRIWELIYRLRSGIAI